MEKNLSLSSNASVFEIIQCDILYQLNLLNVVPEKHRLYIDYTRSTNYRLD